MIYRQAHSDRGRGIVQNRGSVRVGRSRQLTQPLDRRFGLKPRKLRQKTGQDVHIVEGERIIHAPFPFEG